MADIEDSWDDEAMFYCGMDEDGLDNGHYDPRCTLQECFCGVTEHLDEICSHFLDFWKMISLEEE